MSEIKFRVHTSIGKIDVMATSAEKAAADARKKHPDAQIAKIKVVKGEDA